MGDRIPDDEADEIVQLLAAGDGKIDITESTEVVMGEPMTDSEADEIISYIDKSNDQKIDYEEFLTMLMEADCEIDNEDDDDDHGHHGDTDHHLHHHNENENHLQR
eukprot:sb/3477863/